MTPNRWTPSTYCANGACAEVQWQRSPHCQGGSCLEVGCTPDAVLVRDSKLTDSPVLTFDPDVWRGLLADVRAGRIGVPA